MLSARALRDTITVYIRTYPGASGSGEGGTDRYGNAIADESTGVEYPAYVEPFRLAYESLDDQDRRDNRVKVFLTPDAPLDGVSRFEWNSSSYEVVGEPNPVAYRNGLHHQEIIGKRVLGG